MAFFAQTGPNAQARLAALMGPALAQGVARNFTPPEQLANERRLSQAFQNIPENASLMDIYKTAGPALASTPGGMELLAPYAQAAQKRGYAKAYQDLYANLGKKEGALPTQVTPQQVPQATKKQVSPEQEFLQDENQPKERFAGIRSTYPEQATNLNIVPLPTPDEEEALLKQALQQQEANGLPPDINAAQDIVDSIINKKREHNRNVRAEKQDLANIRKENVAWGLGEAQRMNLFDPEFPEDQNVFQDLMIKNEGAPSPQDQFKAAYQEYQNYLTHRENIASGYKQPGKYENFVRKMLGNEKDKKDAINSIQPDLKYYKDNSLDPEARNLLVNHVNFGPEDAERALYPPSKNQETDLVVFPKAPVKSTFSLGLYGPKTGISRNLNDEQLGIFQNDLQDYLDRNPNANLLALRGDLMRKKGYDWQDIDKAFVALRNSGKWKPANNAQEYQYGILHNSPVPGITEIFKSFWEETL